MSIYHNQNIVRPFIYKGHLPTSAAKYRMWVDCPTVTTMGPNGYGHNIFPDSQIVLDWINESGLYPTNPSSYDVAYIKSSSSFNFGNAMMDSASDTRMALTTIPKHIHAYRGTPKPICPWEDDWILGSMDLLPNHGDGTPATTGPCFVAFSRRPQDSSEEYYCGDYDTITVKQRMLIASTKTELPTLNHMISIAAIDSKYNEPLMFWGMSPDDYVNKTQIHAANYVKRFTVDADDSDYGVDTTYTYYEDTESLAYGQLSAASVAPWVVVGAPGWSSHQSPVLGNNALMVVRASLGISFS